MLTTLASYRQITNDLTRSLTAAARQPQVARETEYYLANIESVTSVDDFLNDRRLFSYAMKAHGLEEMTYAEAFMRKVLESDLNDPSSFANSLTDKRYLEFAKAFHFLPSGDVDVGATTAQDLASEDVMIGLYSQQRINKGAAAAVEAEYYQSQIGSITSVDQFLADERLFNFALTAHDITAKYASVSAIRDVLTSDLSDPDSVANRYAANYDDGANYLKLASAFSFETDGSVAPSGSAQTSDQANQTIVAYYDATGTDASPAAAAFKMDYFNELIAGITNVDDLVDNEFMRSYVATSAGLDPNITGPATLRQVLISDLSDPDSPANNSASLKAVAEAFNFNTDGSLDGGVAAQDADQSVALTNLFLANYDDAAIETQQADVEYYRNVIGSVIHVDDLLDNTKLYNFVLSSLEIDPSEVTKSKVKKAMLSDPTSATSYANQLHDSRFAALAAAFNFDSDGYTQGVKQAQTDRAVSNTTALYTETLGELKTDKKIGEAETQYYTQTIRTITSVDDLLKDQRLKAYIVKAYGLEPNVYDDTLRNVFSSDLFDRNSFVNKPENAAYQALAADFNFDSDGNAARSDVGVVQDRGERIATQNLFLRQTVETNAGEENEGVRLALYFERNAHKIHSAYGILADKALLQVLRTTLSLPEQISLLDIDTQADLINDRIDLDDLKDPDKLAEFMTTFTAKWEIDNPSSPTSAAGILIGQPVEAGVNIDLLSSLQNLRLGGG